MVVKTAGMTLTSPEKLRAAAARELTVAHQTPGECEWCDRRHEAIVARIATEVARNLRAAVLTTAERKFLSFALDQAADETCHHDGFTNADWAALEKLRRMAGGDRA